MRFGLEKACKPFFEHADIAISGPNVGSNDGLIVLGSGTVGAAAAAAALDGYPAIAFSGQTGPHAPWYAEPQKQNILYAHWSMKLLKVLVTKQHGWPKKHVGDESKRYMPKKTFLNVNFPPIGPEYGCEELDDVNYVLSRIYEATPVLAKGDINICDNRGR